MCVLQHILRMLTFHKLSEVLGVNEDEDETAPQVSASSKRPSSDDEQDAGEITRQWYWDDVIIFTRWQHHAVGHGARFAVPYSTWLLLSFTCFHILAEYSKTVVKWCRHLSRIQFMT